jgi:hypothetical protein
VFGPCGCSSQAKFWFANLEVSKTEVTYARYSRSEISRIRGPQPF